MNEKRQRIPELDGLRVLMIFIVISMLITSKYDEEDIR